MINHILVPVDFSLTSQRAVDWAFFIAKRTDATIHIYHMLERSPGWYKDQGTKDKKLISDEEYLSFLDKEFKKFDERAEQSGLHLTTSYSSGKLIAELDRLVHEQPFDLVVMGAHGMDYYNGFMGSNTVKVVRKLHDNILIVKANHIPGEFDCMMYATGLDESDRKGYRFLVKFGQLFGANESHIVSVNTQSYFSQPTIVMKEALHEFAELSPEVSTKTHFYKNSSVLAGIQEFSSEHKVDLVGLSNHETHPLKRIFFVSTVESLVQLSDCPVLCIENSMIN